MLRNKRTIAILIENYMGGGSDKIVRELVDNLKYKKLFLLVNQGNDLSMLLSSKLPSNVELITYKIWTLAEMGTFANSFKKKNQILYLFLKMLNLVARYPAMLFYIIYFYLRLSKYDIDVFFSNNGGYPGGECNRMATLSAYLLKKPNYHIVHNIATPPFSKLLKPIEYFIDSLICKCSTIICVSKQTKDELLKKRYITSEPLVIYNGVKEISREIKKFEFSENLKLLNIGALGNRKNQLMIIKTMNILKNKGFSNLELYILGKEEDNGYVDSLRTKIQEYGLEKNIHFEGYCSNPYRYYQMCDVFVLSSMVESFALVRVEAMSVGMPVISTDVGDAHLQIENGENGYIVHNVDEMASAIEKYILNKNLIQLHSQIGFEKFKQNFTLDKMIEKYQKLVDKG